MSKYKEAQVRFAVKHAAFVRHYIMASCFVLIIQTVNHSTIEMASHRLSLLVFSRFSDLMLHLYRGFQLIGYMTCVAQRPRRSIDIALFCACELPFKICLCLRDALPQCRSFLLITFFLERSHANSIRNLCGRPMLDKLYAAIFEMSLRSRKNAIKHNI